MNIDTNIRVLARSSYYQSLYNASKDCSNISLFDNSSNFSGPQVRLLYWLKTYNLLYQELSTFEDETLTETKIDNDFLCDCYLIHRNKKQEFLWKKYRNDEREANLKAKKKKPFKNPGNETTYKVALKREK